MSTEIAGFDKLLNLIDKVKELPERVQKKVLKGAAMDVARQVRKIARKNAPEKSGILKAHIVAVPSRSKDKGVIRVAVLVRRSKNITKKFKDALKAGKKIRTNKAQTKTDGYYAYFVERGTKYQEAQNFLQNALNAVEPKMHEIAEKHIDEFLRKNGWL
ncbi:HK97-gp10 family putative phage morphogenesis protein [Campylobacter showae]|uniref:Phage protein, HK97 gp10 family n=1 Tax=Campylobacter showae CSUNSWCD TaxID=1244083 RepID=M5IH60_9BACT|nr:HK97-gp10 family putative phage morphogenesis protein [Campylobacter showae]EKU10130.1 hypothetical protein CSUNSWCD_1494 [Campylobacter showae CSUNSWCD]